MNLFSVINIFKTLVCHISGGTLSTYFITLKVLHSQSWMGQPLWNVCVTNYNGHVSFVVVKIPFR